MTCEKEHAGTRQAGGLRHSRGVLGRFIIFPIMLLVLLSAPAAPGETPGTGGDAIKPMQIDAVGRVVRTDQGECIEILPQFAPALEGLKNFSHVWVLFWFHENDTPENRRTLKVHPRRDPANPLTGVFATRAPVRPNLIGLTACRVLGVAGNRLIVSGLDAKDDTPVLDLKPYIPESDSHPEARTPDWVRRGQGRGGPPATAAPASK